MVVYFSNKFADSMRKLFIGESISQCNLVYYSPMMELLGIIESLTL